MTCSRARLRPAAVPTAALALTLLASAAQAGPADLVLEVLGSPDFAASVDYDSVVDTGDGGVEILGLSLTGEVLRTLGAIGSLDTWEEPASRGEPAVLTFETVRLGAGAIDALFGVQGDAPADSLAFGLDGFRMDLAALADEPAIAMMRQYLGGMDMLAGSAEVTLSGATPVYDVAVVVDLAGVGRFEMNLAGDEEAGPPSGSISFTDTAGRGLAGLMAFIQRMPVEMSLRMAQSTLRDMREHPANNPDAEDPIFDLLGAEVAAAEALLARFPADGPAAAAAMAAWAEEMADALPHHAALFAAIEAFAETSGTLRLHFAPQEDTIVPMEAAFEIDFYTDVEAFDAVIGALGMSAEFEPAG